MSARINKLTERSYFLFRLCIFYGKLKNKLIFIVY